jgi:hypothetical protein
MDLPPPPRVCRRCDFFASLRGVEKEKRAAGISASLARDSVERCF